VNSSAVTGYRLHPYNKAPMMLDWNTTNVTFELSGWDPHPIQLSTIFSDGQEAYTERFYIAAPICEGGPSPLNDLIMLLPFAGVCFAVALVAMIIWLRKEDQ
jgi:hypothetical protein